MITNFTANEILDIELIGELKGPRLHDALTYIKTDIDINYEPPVTLSEYQKLFGRINTVLDADASDSHKLLDVAIMLEEFST